MRQVIEASFLSVLSKIISTVPTYYTIISFEIAVAIYSKQVEVPEDRPAGKGGKV